MVKRLKRQQELTLPAKDRLAAALARMKSGTTSDEDIEILGATSRATLALRDQIAAMSDAELAEWVARMRRQLR